MDKIVSGRAADAEAALSATPTEPEVSALSGNDQPRGKKLAGYLVLALLTALWASVWGQFQYYRGFRLGVDTTLCAWRVGVLTQSKNIPSSLAECKSRDRDAGLAEDAGTAAEPRSGSSPGLKGIAHE